MNISGLILLLLCFNALRAIGESESYPRSLIRDVSLSISQSDFLSKRTGARSFTLNTEKMPNSSKPEEVLHESVIDEGVKVEIFYHFSEDRLVGISMAWPGESREKILRATVSRYGKNYIVEIPSGDENLVLLRWPLGDTVMQITTTVKPDGSSPITLQILSNDYFKVLSAGDLGVFKVARDADRKERVRTAILAEIKCILENKKEAM